MHIKTIFHCAFKFINHSADIHWEYYRFECIKCYNLDWNKYMEVYLNLWNLS